MEIPMQSTKFLQALNQLKADYAAPVSYMDITRDAVLRQVAMKNNIEMPAILDEEQRKVFTDRIDMVASFLESQNGADTIELLINAFTDHCDKLQNSAKSDIPEDSEE